MKKIIATLVAPFLISMSITTIVFAPLACGGSTAQVKTGGIAAGACSFDLFLKYAAQIKAALAKEGWEQALADVAKTNNIPEDAIICLVQGIAATLSTPSGSASTSEPEPTLVHARSYLAKHGAK